MPLALDTNERFSVVLESDLGKPEGERPTFTFRFLSIREWREVAKVGDDKAALDAMAPDDALDAILDAIRLNLVGWRHMKDRRGKPIEFSYTELDTVLTLGEAWELYYSARRQNRLDPESKKNSESPSPTATAKSAASADPETAGTSPQPSSPSS